MEGQVVLQGINDLPEALDVSGQFGYVSFDGTVKELRPVSFHLEAGERAYVLKEDLPDRDYTAGTIMLYVDGEEISNAWLRMDDMRRLRIGTNRVECVKDVKAGEDRIFTVRSAGFAHGVHVSGNWKCTDNYFDLLPGEEKTFIVRGAGDAELSVETVTF